VRAGGLKFIEAPRPELYDLHADPGELTNRYQTSDAAVQKFRGMLSEIKANASAPVSNLPDPKDKIDEQNLLHTAMMASDDNRTDEARQALEKVLQLDPKSPTALRQLGELEFHSGDFALAAEHLKQARQVRPEDSTAAFYEGQAREKTGDFAGARDALEASLKLTPSQFPARLLLGQVYLALKDRKNAEDQFEAALLLQPKSAEAQLGLTQAQRLGKSGH
jgi:tetratricopeptide (TPR) repeat protein